MPYPVQTFPNFNALLNYMNTFWITNGVQEITGVIGNNVVNGLLTFIEQSPLNWNKADLVSGGGNVSANNAVTVFMTTTPSSLTFTDNIYHEYLFVNMTANDIPLTTPQVYYNTSGNPVSIIPANSAVDIFKASNDLWIQAYGFSGSGRAQKQPKTYFVGTTVGAPTAGTNTWQNPDFKNSYVTLTLSRSILIDMADDGTGTNMVITKPLGSDTLTISNYTWNTGDILSYILITP